MPTQSETDYELKQDRYRRAVDDFVSGRDTVSVFKARLYGMGYRGAEISTEVDLALLTKAERKAPIKYSVIVMAKGRPLEAIKFKDGYSAGFAIKLLRSQPGVRLAYLNME